MVKRTLSAILWFLTCAWGFNFVALLLGLPASAGLVIATGVGLFVVVDPIQVLWQTRDRAPEPLGLPANVAHVTTTSTV